MPAEFRDFAFNTAEIVDVNQEIQSTDEWALKNLDYVCFIFQYFTRTAGHDMYFYLVLPKIFIWQRFELLNMLNKKVNKIFN